MAFHHSPLSLRADPRHALTVGSSSLPRKDATQHGHCGGVKARSKVPSDVHALALDVDYYLMAVILYCGDVLDDDATRHGHDFYSLVDHDGVMHLLLPTFYPYSGLLLYTGSLVLHNG